MNVIEPAQTEPAAPAMVDSNKEASFTSFIAYHMGNSATS